MATLSSDDVVRVWDTLQGKLLHGFVHDGEIKVAALSFTSKLLAVGGANGNVTVYDLIQDKRRRHFSGHRAAVNGLHFAPGGGPLLSSGEDGLMFFWDVHAPPLADAAPEPGEADLSAAFDRLGHAEPAEAYKAIDELSAHPAAAIKLLKKRLKPAAPIDAKRVQQLVLDLRNASFAKRDHAMQELIKLDARVAPALEAVLRDNPNAETKRRIEKVFEALETKRSSPENLRGVRAVEVLERIGGTDAAAILQSLVAGAPGDRLTEAARESLRRNQ
jgi:hypothetical protein